MQVYLIPSTLFSLPGAPQFGLGVPCHSPYASVGGMGTRPLGWPLLPP